MLLGGYNEFLEHAQVCELSLVTSSEHRHSLTLFSFSNVLLSKVFSALFSFYSGFKQELSIVAVVS